MWGKGKGGTGEGGWGRKPQGSTANSISTPVFFPSTLITADGRREKAKQYLLLPHKRSETVLEGPSQVPWRTLCDRSWRDLPSTDTVSAHENECSTLLHSAQREGGLPPGLPDSRAPKLGCFLALDHNAGVYCGANYGPLHVMLQFIFLPKP